jgi:hypothetical protein
MNHLREDHLNAWFDCEKCDFEYRNFTDILAHSKKSHADMPVHEMRCTVCLKLVQFMGKQLNDMSIFSKNIYIRGSCLILFAVYLNALIGGGTAFDDNIKCTKSPLHYTTS